MRSVDCSSEDKGGFKNRKLKIESRNEKLESIFPLSAFPMSALVVVISAFSFRRLRCSSVVKTRLCDLCVLSRLRLRFKFVSIREIRVSPSQFQPFRNFQLSKFLFSALGSFHADWNQPGWRSHRAGLDNLRPLS